MFEKLPKEVKIMEVGPRDGLQNENVILATKDKLRLIETLTNAGIKRIEITSFVSPKWIPPLADQIAVAKGIKKQSGVKYCALVPNLYGFERAIDCGIDEVSLIIATTNSHNKKNLNANTIEVLERYKKVTNNAIKINIPFRVYISCAYGCPYEGEVSLKNVIDLSKTFFDLGAYEIAISDTIGIGNPKQTYDIISALSNIITLNNIALHLHDTRGMALANIFMALTMGVSSFDSSIGGLGGCPYAETASGNVSSEDMINLFHSLKIKSGIDLAKLCAISAWLQKKVNHQLPAKMLAFYNK